MGITISLPGIIVPLFKILATAQKSEPIVRACAIIEKSLTSIHDGNGSMVGNENAELIFNTKDWLYTMCSAVVRPLCISLSIESLTE